MKTRLNLFKFKNLNATSFRFSRETKIHVRYKKAHALAFTLLVTVLSTTGCATNGKTLVAGMTAGAVAGAGVGSQFYYEGDRTIQTQNAIIGAGIGALLVGGFLSWHYRTVERELEQVSGRFARSRLCDPESLGGQGDQTTRHYETGCSTHLFSLDQVGEAAIDLDDNTKWALPQFRKRYMQPETDEDKVVSERYLWEIIKPGSFVTRSKNAEYFLQKSSKKDSMNQNLISDGRSDLKVEIEFTEDKDVIKGSSTVPPLALPETLPKKEIR